LYSEECRFCDDRIVQSNIQHASLASFWDEELRLRPSPVDSAGFNVSTNSVGPIGYSSAPGLGWALPSPDSLLCHTLANSCMDTPLRVILGRVKAATH